MGKPKTRDLWTAEGCSKSVSRPAHVHIAKKWAVEPDKLPTKAAAPRRRKVAPARPNNRAAVAEPLAGQSYNPLDVEHQAALRKAVRQLEKKRTKDAKFVAKMTAGRDQEFQGSMTNNVTWDEEINDASVSKKKKKGGAASTKTVEQVKTEAKKAAKKVKRRKKMGKLAAEREARHAYVHRRHPDRELSDVENLDELLVEHTKHHQKLNIERLKRRAAKKENLQIKHYGRYYHQPLVVDVAPSDKLVGSLRHLNGSYVHPAMERLKSLEERNLIPARMRHRFNKRKTLKPKGEVRVKRETFGTLPETSF